MDCCTVSAVVEAGVTSTFDGLTRIVPASFWISGGIVAEKNNECFFAGSLVSNFRTSWIKPMSSILSASSSTKYRICCRFT